MRDKLDRVVEEYRKALDMPDPAQIHAVFGTIAANLIRDAAPVWLVIIGPPSSGKSDPLKHLRGLANIHQASEISAPGLLSCSPRKDKKAVSTGGLLTSIGDFGILVVSDMSTTISMHPERLAQLLSIMRDVYDGHVVRHMGQDGGVTRAWTGKIGLIAASTNEIDRHHAVINALGDRYLYFRMPVTDVRAKMNRARKRESNRQGIREAIVALLDAIREAKQPELTDQVEDWLQATAELVARCRAAVVRDGITREVEFLANSEEPTRLYLTLRTLVYGLMTIGLDESEAMNLASRIALDSLPPARLTILKSLARATEPVPAKPIFDAAVDVSDTTMRRALEELTLYRSIVRTGSNGVPALYSPSDWLKEVVARLPEPTFPALSSISLEKEKEGI